MVWLFKRRLRNTLSVLHTGSAIAWILALSRAFFPFRPSPSFQDVAVADAAAETITEIASQHKVRRAGLLSKLATGKHLMVSSAVVAVLVWE